MIIKTVIILKADQETLHRSCIIHQMPLKAISCQFPRKVSEAFARHEEVFIQQPHPEEFPQTYNKKCWSLFGVLGHRTTEWKKSPEKLSEHKSQWYILTSTKLRGNSFLDGAGPCISFTLNSHSLYVLPWLFLTTNQRLPSKTCISLKSSLEVQAAPLQYSFRDRT